MTDITTLLDTLAGEHFDWAGLHSEPSEYGTKLVLLLICSDDSRLDRHRDSLRLFSACGSPFQAARLMEAKARLPDGSTRRLLYVRMHVVGSDLPSVCQQLDELLGKPGYICTEPEPDAFKRALAPSLDWLPVRAKVWVDVQR